MAKSKSKSKTVKAPEDTPEEVELTEEEAAEQKAEDEAFGYEKIKETLLLLMPVEDKMVVHDRAGNKHTIPLNFGLRQSTHILAAYDKFVSGKHIHAQIQMAWDADEWFGVMRAIVRVMGSPESLDTQVEILNIAYPDLEASWRPKFSNAIDHADVFLPKETTRMLGAILGKSVGQAWDPVKTILASLGLTEKNMKKIMGETSTPELSDLHEVG